MEFEELKELGLNKGETKVYSTLVSSGAARVNKIHEATGIERRNIYDILNKLIEKGLVSYINENGTRLYNVGTPEKIMNYILEKETKLEEIKKEAETIIPELNKALSARREEIYAEIYRGGEGMKTVFEDSLNYPEIYWIGGGRYMPKMFPTWTANWTRKRIKRKVQVYYLARHELRAEVPKPYGYEKMKFLPEEFSKSPIVIGIYGDKVTNYLFGKTIIATVTKSKELAESYKAYHKYLWDNVAKD
jgi:sugar-specific transcriptional regulator TrmB